MALSHNHHGLTCYWFASVLRGNAHRKSSASHPDYGTFSQRCGETFRLTASTGNHPDPEATKNTEIGRLSDSLPVQVTIQTDQIYSSKFDNRSDSLPVQVTIQTARSK